MQAFEYFTKQSNFSTFEKYSTYLAGPFIMYIIGKHVKSKWVHHFHNDYCILRWTSWPFLKLEIEILLFFGVTPEFRFPIILLYQCSMQKTLYWWSDTLQRELHLKAFKYNAILFEIKVFPQTLLLLGDVWRPYAKGYAKTLQKHNKKEWICIKTMPSCMTLLMKTRQPLVYATEIQDGGYWCVLFKESENFATILP